jgi:hypothetical protein
MIEWKRKAVKQLLQLDNKVQAFITGAVESLSD